MMEDEGRVMGLGECEEKLELEGRKVEASNCAKTAKPAQKSILPDARLAPEAYS